MKVIINGQIKVFEENLNLQEIIENLKIEDKVMACAVNMDIVKKENWNSYKPNENDIIELLNFVGGG
ncbi:thiamine biosynthesis protein ThiS [Aliarcobacter trophiarum LMG 25534]|uniref:Thiamine biosynthesis protein n=1 Tax=Aliarcobacter trophiarum LMG 25534 TaxID=1032241 RepID=A0AAD0VLC5_9BACT|nr:sulfur carrier protein ThiS [Aliarcobacter trophiarum]AXK48078.1 thiamine biosynthesis protein [Aliarcobacter trophiarum LMG 25534]RXI27773.1 thiamine biosynthesis protein ThiS [Aliarcobacter trophiarum]RXJ93241.1 thiamine biosynthesis protein ThiS [Aliarcobacter trophiarum LMG 25534]